MPGPLLAAGLAAGGSLLNAGLQGTQNRADRKFTEKMYRIQRADSLADWNMQNAYNSPEQQMLRLKSAGLNPNLVYGNGATAEASMPRQSTISGSARPAPQLDVNGTISTYYNSQLQSQTVDNLKRQNELMAKDAVLKDAQTLATLASANNQDSTTALNRVELKFREPQLNYQLSAASANIAKTIADTDYTVQNNIRANEMQQSNLNEAIQRIISSKINNAKTQEEIKQIKANVENMKKDGTLKQLDINLRKLGLNPNDPTYQRIIAQALQNIGNTKPWTPGERDAFFKKFVPKSPNINEIIKR